MILNNRPSAAYEYILPGFLQQRSYSSNVGRPCSYPLLGYLSIRTYVLIYYEINR
jgi:hypothetical protein